MIERQHSTATKACESGGECTWYILKVVVTAGWGDSKNRGDCSEISLGVPVTQLCVVAGEGPAHTDAQHLFFCGDAHPPPVQEKTYNVRVNERGPLVLFLSGTNARWSLVLHLLFSLARIVDVTANYHTPVYLYYNRKNRRTSARFFYVCRVAKRRPG